MTRSHEDFAGEHSKAKVDLYAYYLAIYINIMALAGFASKILLFDLFAGEGEYENGLKGSPLAALEVVRRHYEKRGSCPDMKIVFNDNGKSDIEKSRYKIDRVKEFADKIPVPQNVETFFTRQDFSEALAEAKKTFGAERKPVALFLLIRLATRKFHQSKSRNY